MKLHEIDILIICAYLIAMIVIGLILPKIWILISWEGNHCHFICSDSPMLPECLTSQEPC